MNGEKELDNMNVNSKFMRYLLSCILSKISRTRFGVDPDITFNDPIKIECGEDQAHIHLNLDVTCKRNQFEQLLERFQL